MESDQQSEQKPLVITPEAPNRRKIQLSKPLQIALIGLALLLLVGLWYFVMYMPNRSINIFRAALTTTLQQQSAQFQIAYNGANASTFTATGSVDRSGAFMASGTFTAKQGHVDIAALAPQGNATLYVKFTNVGQLPQVLGDGATQFGISATKNPFQNLDGTWLELSTDMTKSLLSSAGAAAPNLSGTNGQGLSQADQQKLADAYRRNEFLVVAKTLPDEAVAGEKSYHFQVRVDEVRLQNFFRSIKSDIPAFKTLDDSQITSIANMGTLKQPIDVWISQSDKRIKQVSLAGIRLTFTSFGQPVKVEKPANSKSLLDALSGVLVSSGLPTIQN